MKTTGLFLPADVAICLSTQLEQIHEMATEGPVRALAIQAMKTFQSGTSGEFQVCETGPTGEGAQRSDLMTYAANLARQQAARTYAWTPEIVHKPSA